MSGAIKRAYVQKKPEFAVETRELLADFRNNLGLAALRNLTIINRYDVDGLSDSEFLDACTLVLAEPAVDEISLEKPEIAADQAVFCVELLPGQYDQREDYAAQCIQLITQKERPAVAYAKVYVLTGELSPEELAKIKNYCINPIEAREAELALPETLETAWLPPADVAVLSGFCRMTEAEASGFCSLYGLAMSKEDVLFVRDYFKNEKREPTITELRVLDTYWSDHCRHTTFNTEIEEVVIENSSYTAPVGKAYKEYLAARDFLYGADTERPVTLMDVAVIGMKKMRAEGKLDKLDASEEVNACSIVVPLSKDGKTEDWLIMFKNETHNHPTEIEPFGGAATCLGGAIRDPLSGRSYVYQAMRVTGAADPRQPIEETLPGKLPQRKICLGAAAGYSSYGNQIGLATGQVSEYYHPRFVAKRMEVGAVVGAVPRAAVVRKVPQAGDLIILLGGRTGRDGCGGATGSSKEHTAESLLDCAAEVQKGNPPTERRMQRLFRDPEAASLVKRCNDFGAGGVSVACGELTDGLEINLDKVPKKYEGLDGTELAISESQERLAVVLAPADWESFAAKAAAENLEATVIAEVKDDRRLVMLWRGKKIVDLSREFLNTNGVSQKTTLKVKALPEKAIFPVASTKTWTDFKAAWLDNLQRLNVCSQKGLAERFDSTIGRGTVLLPFGGKNQLTPAEGMVSLIPGSGQSRISTAMSHGYNPEIACSSPFHGAMYAVVESVARLCAVGVELKDIYLTLQEYFPRLAGPDSWGEPFSALLGAFSAADALGVAAVGGKDSMSGTFADKKVPPTLISFAVAPVLTENVLSPEFKAPGNEVIFLPVPLNEGDVVDYAAFKEILAVLTGAIKLKKNAAVAVIKEGGLSAALSSMCIGNDIGLKISSEADLTNWFGVLPGAFAVELADGRTAAEVLPGLKAVYIGTTVAEPVITKGAAKITLAEVKQHYLTPLDGVYPRISPAAGETVSGAAGSIASAATAVNGGASFAKPRVLIPVFPGTNCEYDTAAAFAAAGGHPQISIVRNLTPQALESAITELAAQIRSAQIIVLPGGFSAADEPEGSGKFIATMLRNPRLKEALEEFLYTRKGLMLGVCNGFQALIKLGLLPYGEILPQRENGPTLTFNTIGRHISQMVTTKIVSVQSPWLRLCAPGELHQIAVSHGEGRFCAEASEIKQLLAQGQVAAQYVDMSGTPSAVMPYNPNGSMAAVEGLLGLEGRIFGKMGHSERFAPGLMKNIPGNKEQQIFLAGVQYYK